MMQAYTYLTINFLTVIICFIASFDRRIQFHKHFKTFFLSATIVAVPFIAWDVWFTKTGVWWFDTDYTLGFTVAGLPLEELLFFWCIPFACVFTYFVIEKYFKLRWTETLNNVLVFVSTIILIVAGGLYYTKTYTLTTVIVTLFTLFFVHFIAQKDWLGKASFVYFLLLPGFFAVNGVLTGTGIERPVVNYNPEDFVGIRMISIPVEDMVYGYSLILLNIYFFKLLKSNKHEEK